MTAIRDVEKALLNFRDNELAMKWYKNDVAKRKIAKVYDAWISDINDHHLYLTLHEHIETCLDTPQYIDDLNDPDNK